MRHASYSFFHLVPVSTPPFVLPSIAIPAAEQAQEEADIEALFEVLLDTIDTYRTAHGPLLFGTILDALSTLAASVERLGYEASADA